MGLINSFSYITLSGSSPISSAANHALNCPIERCLMILPLIIQVLIQYPGFKKTLSRTLHGKHHHTSVRTTSKPFRYFDSAS